MKTWVKVFGRVSEGEMPPPKKTRPTAELESAVLAWITKGLVDADRQKLATQGRAIQRRLNRYEYENAMRDMLQAPCLQIRDALPEDGEPFRFNKVGGALDVSHVQMARYLSTADEPRGNHSRQPRIGRGGHRCKFLRAARTEV